MIRAARLRTTDGFRVGNRLTAGRLDLVDDLRRNRTDIGAVALATRVVHDHLGAFARHQQRMLAPDASAGTGNNNHLVC